MDGPSARGVLSSGGDDAIACPSSAVSYIGIYIYIYCVGGGISISNVHAMIYIYVYECDVTAARCTRRIAIYYIIRVVRRARERESE